MSALRTLVSAAAVVLVLCSGSAPAAQSERLTDDDRRALEPVFRRGIDAEKDGRWEVMRDAMREAITLRPSESRDKLLGTNLVLGSVGGTEYLPHFFLGQASYRLDDCAGAIVAWEQSLAQGVVQGDRLQTIREGLARCEKDGFLTTPGLEDARKRVQEAIEAARWEANALTPWREDNSIPPEIREQWTAANDDLADAENKRSAGEATRRAGDFDEAIERANDATKTYIDVKTKLNQRRSFDERLQAVVGIVRNAEERQRRVTDRPSEEHVRVVLRSEFSTLVAQSNEDLERARLLIGQARETRVEATLSEASARAGAAEKAFGEVLLEVERLIAQQKTRALSAIGRQFDAASDQLTGLEELLQGLAVQDGRVEKVRAGLVDARRAYRDARRRFDQAAKASDLRAAQSASQPLGSLNESLNAIAVLLGVAGRPVLPGVLLSAYEFVQAFGQHDVLDILTPAVVASFETPEHRGFGHLLRFVALHRIFMYSDGGEAGDRQREEARAEAVRCAQLGAACPSLERIHQFFGPVVRDFFAAAAEAAR